MPSSLGVHDVASNPPPRDSSLQLLLHGERGSIGDRAFGHWELRTHSILNCLMRRRLMSVAELRRGIEALEARYTEASYYERWAASITMSMLERGLIQQPALNASLGSQDGPRSQFSTGQAVRVREASFRTKWRKPHMRTPGYIHGVVGRVVGFVGQFADPELEGFWGVRELASLYIVRFDAKVAPAPLDGR